MNPQQPGGPAPQQQQPGWPPANPQQPAQSGPAQSYTAAPAHPAGQQYEFIMNPGKPAKRPLLLPTGSSMLSRVMLALGGLVVLIVIGVIASSLFGSKGSDMTSLVSVAQDQAELIRVSQLATGKADGQTAKNTAISVQLALTSANSSLVTYLATNHQKLSNKDLALKHDVSTDTKLTAADSASNFDPTFISVIQAELAIYQRDLKVAYATKPGPKGEQLLKSQYDGATLLLTQSKQQ
jgi:hypothetical protein